MLPTFLGPKGKDVGVFFQNKTNGGDLKIPTKVPFPFGTLKGRGRGKFLESILKYISLNVNFPREKHAVIQRKCRHK